MVQLPQKIDHKVRPSEEDTSELLTKKSIDLSGKKILIVDDNKLNIKVARRALDGFNIEMDECYNGLECIDKIKNGNQYDIILMDIMMPVMSGEHALRELKKIEGFSIPVIAVTADAISGSEEKYKQEGFIDYISKPFTKDQIKEKLDKILGQDQKNIEIL